MDDVPPEMPRNLLVGDRLSDDSVRFLLRCLAGIWSELRDLNETLADAARSVPPPA